MTKNSKASEQKLEEFLVSANYEQKKDRFFSVIKKGDLKGVKALINHGLCVNECNVSDTPLSSAVDKNKFEIVKLLIDLGAEIDGRFGDYWTPLMSAAGNGNKEIAKYLIDLGANVNAKSDYNYSWTPLTLALTKKNDGMVKLLVKAGADINSQDSALWTPLMYSLGWGNSIEIIKLLIDSEANVNVRISGSSFSSPNSLTPLIYAAQIRDKSAIEALINAGADINARDDDGKSALDYVTPSPTKEDSNDEGKDIAKILIDAGTK